MFGPFGQIVACMFSSSLPMPAKARKNERPYKPKLSLVLVLVFVFLALLILSCPARADSPKASGYAFDRSGRPSYPVFAARYRSAFAFIAFAMDPAVTLPDGEIQHAYDSWALFKGECDEWQGVYSSLWEAYFETIDDYFAHVPGQGSDAYYQMIEYYYWTELLARDLSPTWADRHASPMWPHRYFIDDPRGDVCD